MNRIKNNKKGFTLIEVVLVLAIGGLIFLLAFIAFQQVSANRRDTQR
ncbi:prepilin-type N-terminal cleavage/methylation domain-containing protein, partial [Candidatus Saccharibacteria bacterium]|nr:prepilin-type N-terminal cleavage/methylation domain-containing protein [Candidatus Saccharibacteria bacterium]